MLNLLFAVYKYGIKLQNSKKKKKKEEEFSNVF